MRLVLLLPLPLRTAVPEGDNDEEDEELEEDVNLFEGLLNFFFSTSSTFSSLPLGLMLILVEFMLIGRTQLQKKPILARRFTQLGIGLPVNLMHASLQKWLQFLVMRLYAFPLYSSAKSPIIPLTSSGPTSVHPIKIAFLKLNPSHCFGSPSNIPVVGYSWAPNAYSTP